MDFLIEAGRLLLIFLEYSLYEPPSEPECTHLGPSQLQQLQLECTEIH